MDSQKRLSIFFDHTYQLLQLDIFRVVTLCPYRYTAELARKITFHCVHAYTPYGV